MVRYLLLLLLVFAGLKGSATHMSGGEIYWECIGPNLYRIKLVVYRDCAGIPVDPSYNLVLTSPCGNKNLTVTTPGGQEISQLCDIQLPNSTCNGGSLPGIQQYEYTGVTTLQPCNSWSIRWTNIYRNNAIVNLMNPNTQEMFIEAVINTATAPCNDSPVFTNTAIPYVCLGYPVSFSYGAIDAEADSLSYDLIVARRAGGNPIPYVAPYTPGEPIPGLVLDPVTGLINFTLNMAGNWVVVVRVTAYNAAGQVIGTVMRDMQFVAYPCDNIPPDAATGLVQNITGAATQTGPRSVEVCESGDFCFEMEISDANLPNVLTAFSNIQQNLPGATFSYTGTNPITVQVCWTAQENTSGFFPFIVNVNDGACPIPAFQTYVYTVKVLPGVYGQLQVQNESCEGAGDGSITAVVTEGTAPYSYTWSTGSSEQTIYGGPGTYDVVIEDSNGCISHTLTADIGPGAPPNEADAGGDMLVCADELPVQLIGQVNGATQGQWSGGQGQISGTGLSISYMPTAAEIQAGSTKLTLTTTDNNSCPPVSDQITINFSNNFLDAQVVSTDATCYSMEDGSAEVIPQDPSFSYAWNDPAQQTTPVATDLGAGTYQVTVADADGCTITMEAVVGPAEPLLIADIVVEDETCEGAGDGSVTLAVTGGTAPYSFEWSNGATTSSIVETAGEYLVAVTDANGCAPIFQTVTIGSAALLNSADAGGDMIMCPTLQPFTIEGVVINAPSGVWSGGEGAFTGTGTQVQYTPTQNELDAGNVTLTLTTVGNEGCPPASDQIVISFPNSFIDAAIATVDASCYENNDGSASFSPADDDLTYLWNDPLGQTTSAATGLAAGTYTLTVTDQYGCSISLDADIGPPDPVSIVQVDVTDETCLGVGDGGAQVTVTGGTAPYSYAWSNGSTSPSISAAAGTYDVSITDANGCAPATGEAIIGAASLPNLADAGADQVVCMNALPVMLNGIVTNASGGAWSGGSGTFNGTYDQMEYVPSAADIAAGSVTLTLTTTGNNDCPPAQDAVVLSIPNSFVDGQVTSTDATCHDTSDGSAVFSPTLPGFSYAWNDAQGQTTAMATGLSAGTHTLVVTDQYGCTESYEAVIGPASPLVIASIDAVSENCAGFGDGQATVTVGGGTAPYSFNWNNGMDQASIQVPAGTYTVSVSDANNCTPVTADVIIDVIGLPNQADAGGDMVICLNDYPIMMQGSVENATGGQWNGGAGAWEGAGLQAQYWPTLQEIMNGSVQLVLTTTGNTTCPPASDTVLVSLANAFLQAELNVTQHVSCNGLANGQLAFTPQLNAFSYQWAHGGTSPTAGDLAPGTYTLTVTDQYGCDSIFTGTITEPETLVLQEVQVSHVICHGGNTGQAMATVTGGTSPYSFQWSNGATASSANGLIAGDHHVTITDANGCAVEGALTIDQPSPITLQANIPDTVCVNAPVLLSAEAQGGNGGHTITWAGIGTGSSLTAEFAASQIVTVTVQDSLGCPGAPVMEPVHVLDLSLAQFDTYGATTVCAGETVTVGATVSGYAGSYTISWPGIPALGAGPFTFPVQNSQQLQVILSNTCGDSQIETLTLGVDVPPAVQLPPIIAQGCAPLTVQFPSFNLGDVNYQWNLGNGQTSSAPAPVVMYPAGTYTATLTVTTPAGCSSAASTSGQIIVHTPPTAAFTASTWSTDLANAMIAFTDQSTGNIVSHTWNFGDGGTSSAINPQHQYTDWGSYAVTLQVQDANGCTASASNMVQISPVYDVTLPTAFTPNTGNGNGGTYDPFGLDNDVFYAFVKDVSDFRMRIFNRWGELIFESDDLRIGWDGYYRGQLSPQDVYVVQTWVRFLDGREIQKLSDLTLLR